MLKIACSRNQHDPQRYQDAAGSLTDRNVGGRNAIVTTAMVLIARLSSLAASPRPVIVRLSCWAIMLYACTAVSVVGPAREVRLYQGNLVLQTISVRLRTRENIAHHAKLSGDVLSDSLGSVVSIVV